MEKCAQAGYSLRALVMPIVPVENWREIYSEFLDELLDRIPLARITLGGICSYKDANSLMIQKLTSDNAITNHVPTVGIKMPDGRIRYGADLREEMYGFLAARIRARRANLRTALCFEDRKVCESVGLSGNIGKCNCLV